MNSLTQVHPQLLLGLHRRSERLFPLLHLLRDLFRPELVVDDLQRASLFNSSVDSLAIRTKYGLAREGVHSLAERLALHVFQVWTTETLEKLSTIRFFEEYMGA